MWLTAATELGPGQWVSNIFNEVMHSSAQAGILVLVWINGIMYLMRQFFGDISHKVSPISLIAVTSLIAAAGLFLFGLADRADVPSPPRRCSPSARRSGGRRCWASRRSGSRGPARWGSR